MDQIASAPALARTLPLEGVTVIAVEQYGAGPFGTMLLADLGAEVIKIENPAEGGEIGRHIGPHMFGPGDSQFYQAFNRNKHSITLNLKHPEGMRLLRQMVAGADAVLDNLRGDLPEKLGLDYASLRDANPAIVCAHLSAYGRDNPRKSWPGYDYLMQAEAGYCSLTGEPEGPPARFGVSLVDMMTGLMCAFGLVSAVVGARRTGLGMDVDVSLFDTALHNLSYLATWYLNEGHLQGREPRGAHPSLTPSQLYRTADGWIFLMCNKDKFWPVLCGRIDRPAWATDPRYSTFKARLANRAAADPRPRRGVVAAHHGRVDGGARRPGAGLARLRRRSGPGQPVRARGRAGCAIRPAGGWARCARPRRSRPHRRASRADHRRPGPWGGHRCGARPARGQPGATRRTQGRQGHLITHLCHG
jgi:crotonobetainyl-CoA:carnitine CoA-transferase CaiB-like acyl-CoA transferase